jgi:glycosyltransferase involved in cell wall biosynthesis
MKILMTTSTFPRWDGDSQAPFILLLAKHLVSLGHEIDLLAPHAHGAEHFEVIDGVSVHRYGYFWPEEFQHLCYGAGIVPNIKKSWLARFQVPFFLCAQAFAILKLNHRRKPDVIHAHWLLPQGLVAAAVNVITRKPLVISIHGSDVFLFRKHPITSLLSWAARKSRRVVANSTAALDILRSDYHVKDAVTIPMGVSTASFTVRRQRKITSPIVLFVGRLIDVKGAEYLLHAVPVIITQVPDARIVIAGDGPERQHLEQLARELHVDDHVVFLGSVPSSKMPELLATSDVFVGPAITTDKGQVEAFGVSFLEAMAAGLPVVTTASGGIKDIVAPDSTAIVIPEKDSLAIATAVNKLLDNPTLRRQMGKAGRARVEAHFTWENVAKQYDEVYRGVRRK